MGNLYNYDEAIAYAIIALNNLLNSANKGDINLKMYFMFIEPLKEIHKKEEVVEYANKLLENEGKEAKNEKNN